MREVVVYVVDDSPDELGGIRSLLASTDWRIERYTSGKEFLDKLDPTRCACLLLDLQTHDMRGTDVLAELKDRGVELPTIIVTSDADVRTAVDAIQQGAIDLLEKPVHCQELIDRIQEALNLDRQRHEQLASRADLEARWARLTKGERAVVRLLIEGKSSREMGTQLGAGRRTIENRRANIMLKMGATSLAHLVRMICGAGKDFPPHDCSK